jgi:hypothetical protein
MPPASAGGPSRNTSNEWQTFRDQVSDNFRVVNHDNFGFSGECGISVISREVHDPSIFDLLPIRQVLQAFQAEHL